MLRRNTLINSSLRRRRFVMINNASKVSVSPCINRNCKKRHFIVFTKTAYGNLCSKECLDEWAKSRYAKWKTKRPIP